MGIPAPIGIGASGLPPPGDQANAVVQATIATLRPRRPFAFRGPMNIAIWASYNTALTTTAGSLAATVAAAGLIAAGSAINSANVPRGTTVGAIVGTGVTLALPFLSFQGSNLNLLAPAYVTLPPGSNVAQLVGASVNADAASGLTLPAGTTVLAVIQQDVAASRTSVGQPGIIQISNAFTAVSQTGTGMLEFGLSANGVTVTGADADATFTGASIVYTGSINIERSFDGGATWLLANIGGAGQLAQYNAGTPVSLTFGEPEKGVLYRINPTAITPVAGISIKYRASQTGGAAESLAIGALT